MPTTESDILPQRPDTSSPKIAHATFLLAAQVARALARLVFALVVARSLGPGEFGVYALLLATVEILAVTSGTGYADLLTREAAKDASAGWGLAWQLTWLRVACLVPFATVGFAALDFWGYHHAVIAAGLVLALTLPPRSITESVQGVLRGLGEYRGYLTIESAFDLTLLVGAGFVLHSGSLRTAVAAEVAAAAVASSAALVWTWALRPGRRVRVSTRELVKKGAIFNIYACVGNLYDRIDVVLLSKLAGNYATGVYSAAYRPIGSIQLLPYAVLYSLLPSFTRNHNDLETQRRMDRATGLLLCAAFMVILATIVYAHAAVTTLLGQRYADSAFALQILIWAAIPRFLNYALNIRLLAAGHERVFVITAMVCLPLNVIGNLVLIPFFSWPAAAAVTIATEFLLLAQNVYWLHRLVGSVPRPTGWVRASLVFAALLVATHLGAKFLPLLLIGTLAVLVFLGYLAGSGMAGEFATAWRERSAAA